MSVQGDMPQPQETLAPFYHLISIGIEKKRGVYHEKEKKVANRI